MNEEQRLHLLKNEITGLFELRCGAHQFNHCPSFAFIGNGMRQWVTYPCSLKNGKRIPARAGYDRMLKSLGKEDRFSMAVSPRKFERTRWLSCEWDFEDVIPDEQFVKHSVDQELLNIIQKHLTIHWKYTGNRSVHLDIFLTEPISLETGKRFLNCARHLLNVECADKTNLTQCMRLPFSRHQKTNGLCRYDGCHDEDTLMLYIQSIKRDEMNEALMITLCEQMEQFLGDRIKQCIIKTKTHLNDTINTNNNNMYKGDNTPPILRDNTHGIGGVISINSIANVFQRRIQGKPRLLSHPKAKLYLHYVRNGISEGEFNRVFFDDKGEFSLFIMCVMGVKEEALQVMRHVAILNVKDETTISNRLSRIKYIGETFFQQWEDCDASFIPAEKLEAFDWLQEFISEMRSLFHNKYNDKRLENNLLQVVQYSLLLLYRHPEGATIAVEDVRRKLKITKKTAIRHLKILREDFPLLIIKTAYDHPAHRATDYVLNTAYVESVLGRSIEDTQQCL